LPPNSSIRFFSVAAAAFALASFPARSEACSCIDPGSVSAGLDASGSVLEGKVLSLRHEPASHRVTARLEVLQRWKGAPGKTVDIVTADQGSMCGFEFRRGARYVIFAQEAASPLSVSICSLSKASDTAAADIAELDRLARGTPATSGSVSAPADAGAAETREPDGPPVEPSPGSSRTATTPASAPASPPAVPKPAERRAPGGSCTGCSFPRPASGAGLLLSLTAAALVTRAARRRRRR
jgi:hypothetical protein